MELLLVRHGESTANAEGRLQGRSDSPLSERGRRQAERLTSWLVGIGLRPDMLLSSPLSRALGTAEVIAERFAARVELESDLEEIRMGALEGLKREEIAEQWPRYLERGLDDVGDFEAYGGESYADVQARVARVHDRLVQRFSVTQMRVAIVGHGGFNYQLLKHLISVPVPRVCIVSMGNCSATLVRMRERRGKYLGELSWHVPLELIGFDSGEGSAGIFR